MTLKLSQLCKLAFEHSLKEYNSLSQAMTKINFIQYDPIRKPLCAQDLILLKRVKGYKPGDLDIYYPDSNFEEDCLYVYGILAKKFATLLHPRSYRKKINSVYQPKGLAADVWNYVREQGEVSLKDVANAMGRKHVTNDWGGKSAATTQALEELHYYGFVRVSKRINGSKVYKILSSPIKNDYSSEERLRLLTLLIVEILSPVSEVGLRRAIGQLCVASSGLNGRQTVITDLLTSDQIECHKVDGIRYFLPSRTSIIRNEASEDKVRFLAPFDPIVWDRNRFEHLWGWNYRFEAYMPQHLRRFGHYALPMFWGEQAVGWVNITKSKTNKINIDRGFVKKLKLGRRFERAYEEEVSHFENILIR